MRAWSIGLVLVLTTASAHAADLPSRETAGAEEARFSERRSDEPAEALLEKQPAIEEAPAPARDRDAGPRFAVKDVHISGNRSIPEKELRPFLQPLVGREVTLGEIQDAADAMKRHYRSRGYVAAYVYVPPQEMENGVLTIDVLEGRIGEVKVAGNRWFSAESVRKLFALPQFAVIRHDDIRRGLRRLNERPDLKAKAVLSPGEMTGTSDVTLEVEERAPFRFNAGVNNYGTRSTGEFRYGVNAAHTNLLGRFDELSVGAQFGKGVDAYGAGYNFPISLERGTRVGYNYSHADVEVGGTFAALGIEGEADTHRAYVSQPIYEKEPFDVDVTAGIDFKRVENRLLDAVSGRDDLTIPNFDVTAKRTVQDAVSLWSNRFNFGIANFLGSSDADNAQASRIGTGGEFVTYRGTITHFQKIGADHLFSVRGTLQASPDALPPSEQLALGGARSVRGYAEGDYLADHGGYVNFDVYWTPPVPDHWQLPLAKENLKKQVQFLAFADVGTASLRRPLSGEPKDKDLAGAGVGFRMRLYDNLYGRFEWAWALGDRRFDSKDKAFYFTLAYDLF